MTTQGINHLGLAVHNLDDSVNFFVDLLGWEEAGRDDSYPRSAVTDGKVRLTLWQVDHGLDVQPFHRRRNVGLHHLALEVATEDDLNAIHDRMSSAENVAIEFPPEPVGSGPRKHMMCYEPGGIRVEFIWPGQ